MKQFEYKVTYHSYLDMESELNKLGKEGWELVNIDQHDRLILKREAQSKNIKNII